MAGTQALQQYSDVAVAAMYSPDPLNSQLNSCGTAPGDLPPYHTNTCYCCKY